MGQFPEIMHAQCKGLSVEGIYVPVEEGTIRVKIHDQEVTAYFNSQALYNLISRRLQGKLGLEVF